MFVVTADQRGSRRGQDLVPQLHEQVAQWQQRYASRTEPFVRPLVRTAGDEVQGVLDDAHAVVSLALFLQRLGEWTVGIGAGSAELAETAPASRGPAFIHARDAVERARNARRSAPLAVTGSNEDRAGEAESLLQLLAVLVRRRTSAGWEAIDLLEELGTQREVAQRLDISAQAVSQRLAAALWDEERSLHPLAARLLTEAGDGEGA